MSFNAHPNIEPVGYFDPPDEPICPDCHREEHGSAASLRLYTHHLDRIQLCDDHRRKRKWLDDGPDMDDQYMEWCERGGR